MTNFNLDDAKQLFKAHGIKPGSYWKLEITNAKKDRYEVKLSKDAPEAGPNLLLSLTVPDVKSTLRLLEAFGKSQAGVKEYVREAFADEEGALVLTLSDYSFK